MTNSTQAVDPKLPSSITLKLLKVALATLLILLIPAVAMLFTSEVNWQLGDFLVMAILLISAGSLSVFLTHKMSGKSKWITILCISALFTEIWVELAVGII